MNNELKYYYSDLRRDIANAKTARTVKMIVRFGRSYAKRITKSDCSKSAKKDALLQYKSLSTLAEHKIKELE